MKDKAEKKPIKQKISESTPVLVLKGLYLFTEGAALLVTAAYAIYSGRYGNLPEWGATILTVAGALVLVPAAILLSKFFRQAANVK